MNDPAECEPYKVPLSKFPDYVPFTADADADDSKRRHYQEFLPAFLTAQRKAFIKKQKRDGIVPSHSELRNTPCYRDVNLTQPVYDQFLSLQPMLDAWKNPTDSTGGNRPKVLSLQRFEQYVDAIRLKRSGKSIKEIRRTIRISADTLENYKLADSIGYETFGGCCEAAERIFTTREVTIYSTNPQSSFVAELEVVHVGNIFERFHELHKIFVDQGVNTISTDSSKTFVERAKMHLKSRVSASDAAIDLFLKFCPCRRCSPKPSSVPQAPQQPLLTIVPKYRLLFDVFLTDMSLLSTNCAGGTDELSYLLHVVDRASLWSSRIAVTRATDDAISSALCTLLAISGVPLLLNVDPIAKHVSQDFFHLVKRSFPTCVMVKVSFLTESNPSIHQRTIDLVNEFRAKPMYQNMSWPALIPLISDAFNSTRLPPPVLVHHHSCNFLLSFGLPTKELLKCSTFDELVQAIESFGASLSDVIKAFSIPYNVSANAQEGSDLHELFHDHGICGDSENPADEASQLTSVATNGNVASAFGSIDIDDSDSALNSTIGDRNGCAISCSDGRRLPTSTTDRNAGFRSGNRTESRPDATHDAVAAPTPMTSDTADTVVPITSNRDASMSMSDVTVALHFLRTARSNDTSDAADTVVPTTSNRDKLTVRGTETSSDANGHDNMSPSDSCNHGGAESAPDGDTNVAHSGHLSRNSTRGGAKAQFGAHGDGGTSSSRAVAAPITHKLATGGSRDDTVSPSGGSETPSDVSARNDAESLPPDVDRPLAHNNGTGSFSDVARPVTGTHKSTRGDTNCSTESPPDICGDGNTESLSDVSGHVTISRTDACSAATRKSLSNVYDCGDNVSRPDVVVESSVVQKFEAMRRNLASETKKSVVRSDVSRTAVLEASFTAKDVLVGDSKHCGDVSFQAIVRSITDKYLQSSKKRDFVQGVVANLSHRGHRFFQWTKSSNCFTVVSEDVAVEKTWEALDKNRAASATNDLLPMETMTLQKTGQALREKRKARGLREDSPDGNKKLDKQGSPTYIAQTVTPTAERAKSSDSSRAKKKRKTQHAPVAKDRGCKVDLALSVMAPTTTSPSNTVGKPEAIVEEPAIHLDDIIVIRGDDIAGRHHFHTR